MLIQGWMDWRSGVHRRLQGPRFWDTEDDFSNQVQHEEAFGCPLPVKYSWAVLNMDLGVQSQRGIRLSEFLCYYRLGSTNYRYWKETIQHNCSLVLFERYIVSVSSNIMARLCSHPDRFPIHAAWNSHELDHSFLRLALDDVGRGVHRQVQSQELAAFKTKWFWFNKSTTQWLVLLIWNLYCIDFLGVWLNLSWPARVLAGVSTARCRGG